MIAMQEFYNLPYVLEFVFLAFLIACLEVQFQEYMGKNMIFDWWYKIIYKMSNSKNLFVKKISFPLGMCKFCNGFWLSALFYVVYYYHTIDIFHLILFTSLNFIFILFLARRINI